MKCDREEGNEERRGEGKEDRGAPLV